MAMLQEKNNCDDDGDGVAKSYSSRRQNDCVCDGDCNEGNPDDADGNGRNDGNWGTLMTCMQLA